MAIVVEEERSKVNIVRLAGWLTVIVVIGAAIYYVFFVTPELVVLPQPTSLNTITPLNTISASLHPETVLNSPGYTSLKPPSFALPDGHAPAGRPNPFIAP